MLYLLCLFARMRKLNKNIAIRDIKAYIITALIARQQFYKTIRQGIKRLITSIKMFFERLLLCKYLCYSIIIRNFALVI